MFLNIFRDIYDCMAWIMLCHPLYIHICRFDTVLLKHKYYFKQKSLQDTTISKTSQIYDLQHQFWVIQFTNTNENF